MKLPKNTFSIVLGVILLFSAQTYSQTKRIKRPKSPVGISSVDRFVTESFDIYDKVYKYDGYAQAGTPLDDNDIDVLEDALTDLDGLSASAPNILNDIDGASVLKQGKATLQINKAKKALKYSVKTAKELLSGQRKRNPNDNEEDDSDSNNTTSSEESSNTSKTPKSKENDGLSEKGNVSDNLEVYSRFDFVPGDKPLFYDDLSNDFIGDFPSKWNTNATGEVVKITGKGKWFQLKAGSNVFYVPEIEALPESYTIEFDILTKGLGQRTSSVAKLNVILSETNGLRGDNNYATVSIPLGQYGAFPLRAHNYFLYGKGNISSSISADIRKTVLNQPHISISVTKNRYRLWINEKKYVDIPKFIEKIDLLKYLKFNLASLKDGEEFLYITNLKIAEGGVDLRRKLMAEGKVSTNAILFDSGLANIKPQSLGVIRQISQVLMQDDNIKLNIIGHTDADGSDQANLKLSKERAEAVKSALINIYNIASDRLQTEGKGETEPISDNTTADGKAQNRRVEFIKI